MEEALGLKPKAVLLEAKEAKEEFSEADLKRLNRRKLVFERRVRGESIEEICEFLLKNGTLQVKELFGMICIVTRHLSLLKN